LKNLLSPVTRHASPILIALYIILAIVASSQAYLLKVEVPAGGHPNLTKYNNYVIFKQSHFHLLEGKNLYQTYPEEHWDLYKYSPAFALFFGGLARLPDWLGLTLWNLLTATLCLVATFYIKIFGIAALILLLLYPGKRKSIPYALFWLGLLGLIPAVVTGFGPLMQSYGQYLDMLKTDQSASMGFSVMGWLKTWFGLDAPKTLLALAGLAVTCLPLIRFRKFTAPAARYLFFSALMVWMVIFNHKAESPTFIIAVSGILIWFVVTERSAVNVILLAFVIAFTSLSPTDIFPFSLRAGFFEPYVIKVVPCILVWLKILFDIFFVVKFDFLDSHISS
jgi:hypothetical protein